MNAFFQELFHLRVYKRSQGRVTRQVTFTAVAVAFVVGMWQLSQSMIQLGVGVRLGVPGILLVVSLWMAYRLVNVPEFADFLISVEAEMNKVSWPTRAELFRASIVVLFTIFALATVLALYDFVWRVLFTKVFRIF